MLDFLLWNKIARVIKQLADTLHISTDRALQIFYDSDVCRMLHDKELGLHLMSDTYIVNDLIEELRNKQQQNNGSLEEEDNLYCSTLIVCLVRSRQMLHDCKIESGYDDSVIRRLSADFKKYYLKLGISLRNLWDMKKFYERFCLSDIKVRQAVALLSWGHILDLLDMMVQTSPVERQVPSIHK